jgi:hypothetical protein
VAINFVIPSVAKNLVLLDKREILRCAQNDENPGFLAARHPASPWCQIAGGSIIWWDHAATGGDMGIRFYCPNGHKLNVKDFQAGRKGVCPHCGAKMQIPLESTRSSSRRAKPPAHGGATEDAAATPVDARPAEVAPEQPAMAAAQGPAVSNASAATALAATPTVSPAGMADPLAEAGDVVWYVRPASGGQYGPAHTTMMRTWLAEGRVAAEALVWREGWRDWQEAGKVFPQLSAGLMSPDLEAMISELPVAPVAGIPAEMPPERRLHMPSTQAIVIGALALTVVILFLVFLAVLLQK